MNKNSLYEKSKNFMKIGIDCLELKPNLAGGQLTYILGLLNGFCSVRSENVSFVIFCTRENKKIFEPISSKYNIELILVGGYFKTLRAVFIMVPLILNSRFLWRVALNIYAKIFGINKVIVNNCDILYVCTTTLNTYNLSVPTVLSMHDIQHVHFPDFFSFLRLRVRRLRFYNSALKATKIQASSNFIKEDLCSFFPFVNPDDVIVIEEGVDLNDFGNQVYTDVKTKYSLPNEFIYFPAALWKHKNHILVLKALNRIYKKHSLKIPLVLTGSKQSGHHEIFKFITDNKIDYVRYLGQVSWQEVVSLHKSARYLITAVLYASSSLPIIEAAASGLPIIASNTPPNVEMSKFLHLNLFDSNSVDSLEKVLLDCWNNRKNALEIEVNFKNVKRYSWDNVASKFLDLFKDLYAV